MVVLETAVEHTHQDALTLVCLCQRSQSGSGGIDVGRLAGFVQAEVEAALFLHANHAGVGSGVLYLVDGHSHHGDVPKVGHHQHVIVVTHLSHQAGVGDLHKQADARLVVGCAVNAGGTFCQQLAQSAG